MAELFKDPNGHIVWREKTGERESVPFFNSVDLTLVDQIGLGKDPIPSAEPRSRKILLAIAGWLGETYPPDFLDKLAKLQPGEAIPAPGVPWNFQELLAPKK